MRWSGVFCVRERNRVALCVLSSPKRLPNSALLFRESIKTNERNERIRKNLTSPTPEGKYVHELVNGQYLSVFFL